ncbi:CheR family methyltransferase [Paracoccus rhizosphaerae]|uniref:Chemotaxis protein methyltransferase n=1 Tax=Paracoccus rhizosphaerae TaxID=1133347 RepID=A0ABV6CNT9_9RHOB|nr:protein-glutamate O-methyltransferase [Paracoccus rhizosphaerae]
MSTPSAPGPQLSDVQFRKIAGLVYEDSGIILSEAKRSLLMARLNRRLRALSLPDYGAYCQRLDSRDGPDERRHLLSAITTNVTAFFRENHHFQSLARAILPPLVEQVRRGRKLRIWSAACSSGEEAYSIALTLLEVMPDAARHDALILATDIDPEMVDRAERGVFSGEALKPVAPAQVKRHFHATQAGVEASAEIRGIMRFAELNLHGDWPFSGRFDVIFCRNAAIYFDGPSRRRLWSRFAGAIEPGGSLYIGHSERLDGPASACFDVAGTTHYRRNLHPVPTTT